MITTAIILAVLNTYAFLIGLLPNSEGLDPSIATALDYIVEVAMEWNYYISMGTLFLTVGLFIVWEFLLYSWLGLRALIRMTRGA